VVVEAICERRDCEQRYVPDPAHVSGPNKQRFCSRRCGSTQRSRDGNREQRLARQQVWQRRKRASPEWRDKENPKNAARMRLYIRKAGAYDALYGAISPWWDEVKKSLQDRSEIPAPPEFTDIEQVA